MKKSATLEKQLTAPEEKRPAVSVNWVALLSIVLYVFSFAHILTAIALSFLNPDLYYAYTQEDGYIEYSTAAFLLATSLLCFYRAPSMDRKIQKVFFYAVASVFFLGFGEEISWGQRIIGFATPENLREINFQDEFTFHNIRKDGIDINKLLFGKLLYTCVFIYFLGFPVLYHHVIQFRDLIDKIKFPVPTAAQSLVYFLSFFSIWIIKEGEKWKMQEFAVASFIFFSFLFPANRKAAPKH